MFSFPFDISETIRVLALRPLWPSEGQEMVAFPLQIIPSIGLQGIFYIQNHSRPIFSLIFKYLCFSDQSTYYMPPPPPPFVIHSPSVLYFTLAFYKRSAPVLFRKKG